MLDFAYTHFVFEADTFTFEDKRMVYQEQRFITLGILNGEVMVVVGYSLKAGLRSRWLSGVEAGGRIRFDSAQRTTTKLSQLKREAVVVHTETENEIRVISLRKATKLNKNFIFPESDDFDEYPEITATDLEGAIYRRNLLEVPKKQSVNLMLDADIIAWFKKKSGEVEFQSLINAALRDVISHNP